MSASGGVAASFGFLYQYLVTADLLLELYEDEGGSARWQVEVDRVLQDSADILVFLDGDSVPDRAIQVKGSLETSTTTMGADQVVALLAAMESEHPGAADLCVTTNRSLTFDANGLGQQLEAGQVGACPNGPAVTYRIDVQPPGMTYLVERVLARIRKLRRGGAGVAGDEVEHLVQARLLHLIHERGARTVDQSIGRVQVEEVLHGSAPVLAEAMGRRAWGRTFQVLGGEYVRRESVAKFLDAALPGESLTTGSVRTATITGISGSGKSAACALHARSWVERYGFVLWLDASSSESLVGQLPSVWEWLGQEHDSDGLSAQSLLDLLAKSPVPWMLVLDGADDYERLRAWVPASGYGHVIITTQRGDWPATSGALHDVKLLGNAEAEALVGLRVGSPGTEPCTDQWRNAAVELAERLGRWPLYVDLACAWVRQRGGDLDTLAQHVVKLERLNPSEERYQSGEYPRTAQRVAQDLWSALSAQSQLLLSMLVVSEGEGVPLGMVEQWAARVSDLAEEPIAFDVHDIVYELLRASLVRQRVSEGVDSPQGFDEVVVIHAGIRELIGREGLELDGLVLNEWIDSYCTVLGDLTSQAQIKDADALLPSAIGLLTTLASQHKELPPGTAATVTMLAHNVGMFATVRSVWEVASRWLTVALNLREVAVLGKVAHPMFSVQQVETIMTLVAVLHRMDRSEEIAPLVERAADLVEAMPAEARSAGTPPLVSRLALLADQVEDFLPSAALQASRLREVIGTDVPAAVADSMLHRLSGSVTDTVDRAIRHADAQRWCDAAQVVIDAADNAVEAGVLIHDVVDGMLDVCLALMVSSAQRPLDSPSGEWAGALARLVGSVEDSAKVAGIELTASQRDKHVLAAAVASADSVTLQEALDAVAERAQKSEVLGAWVQVIEALQDVRHRNSLFSVLFPSGVPEGMEVVRAVDGGDEVRWWEATFQGEPALVVCAMSARRYTFDGESDPLLEIMVADGFPASLGSDGGPVVLRDWSVKIQPTGVEIWGPRQSFVVLEDVEDALIRKWTAAGKIRLVYADDPQELSAVPHQAIVRVTSERRSFLTWLRCLIRRRK